VCAFKNAQCHGNIFSGVFHSGKTFAAVTLHGVIFGSCSSCLYVSHVVCFYKLM